VFWVIYGRNESEVTYKLFNRDILHLDLATGKTIFQRLGSAKYLRYAFDWLLKHSMTIAQVLDS
jgi:hypothetical protein